MWDIIVSIACENSRFSSLFAAGDVSCRGMSATQRRKFHTDDVNQWIVYMINLVVLGFQMQICFNFTFPLDDLGKVLCLSANVLQQNSKASSREDYIPQLIH